MPVSPEQQQKSKPFLNEIQNNVYPVRERTPRLIIPHYYLEGGRKEEIPSLQ